MIIHYLQITQMLIWLWPSTASGLSAGRKHACLIAASGSSALNFFELSKCLTKVKKSVVLIVKKRKRAKRADDNLNNKSMKLYQ